MNIEKVLKLLQTRAASFGYNKKELRGVAEAISNNSALTDDATDEEINAEIEAVIPYLRVGQQQANRIATASRQPTPEAGGDDGATPTATPQDPTDAGTTEPAWAKALREQNEAMIRRLEAIEGEKQTSTRLGRLKALVQGCGAMGEATLRGFARMHFASEDEFDQYASEVEASVVEYKKTLGNDALQSLTEKPGGNGASNPTEKPTDAEIEALGGILR